MPGLAELAGEATHDIGKWATGKLRDTEIGGQVLDAFVNQRNEFMRGTPAGTKVLSMIDRYDMNKNQLISNYMKPVQGLVDSFKDDPQTMKKPLSDIHNSMSNMNPAYAHSSQLMMDPKNHGMNLLELNQKARALASSEARDGVFGAKSENLASAMMSLFKSPDPVMHSHADAILDILSNHLNDTVKHVKNDASETKLNIDKLIKLENKTRENSGLQPLPYEIESVKAYRAGTSGLERLLGRRTRQFLAPLIVIPHISTLFNLSWAPLTAISKTLATYTDHGIQQLVEASGIYSSLMHGMLDEDIRASKGLIASHVGSQYGRLANRVFHNPGFNYLRKVQLHTAGVLGYHSAMYWATEAAQGSKRAMLELKEMQLDVPSIIRRGGQLSNDEKMQAIWHFANNRMFVDRALDRSLFQGKNPWTRMLTMFHGYVTSQQLFMRREFQKMLDAGDYTGLARIAGTFGLVFPTIAPLIASAEVLGRTASPQAAGQELQEKYTQLIHPTGISDYLDLLSYFGTWGTLKGFITASHNDRLALALMGPIAGSATRMSQDIINYAYPGTKSGQRNIRPLGKDILQQTVPVAGNILASRLFPTRRQQKGEE